MRWHKVNEKKPETYPVPYKSVPVWTSGRYWYKGYWENKNWRESNGDAIPNVTHWAEVEPPSEGNTITE